LSGCTEFNGNIILQGQELVNITLNGMQRIYGNLTASSCNQLSKISAPALEEINDTFTLTALPLLTSLEFPALSYFEGHLVWNSLPNLIDVAFNNSVLYVNGDVRISNTSLSSFPFLGFSSDNFTYQAFNQPPVSIKTLQIKDNPRADFFNFTGLTRSSSVLEITNNSPAASILLPDLTSAWNLTLGNAMRIEIPLLIGINGSLEIRDNNFILFSAPNLTEIQSMGKASSYSYHDGLVISNNSFKTFSAPKLESAYGSVLVSDNALLDSLVFPSLYGIANSGIAEFTIVNNPALSDIKLPLFNRTEATAITLSGNLN
jgi:hypothetical protein